MKAVWALSFLALTLLASPCVAQEAYAPQTEQVSVEPESYLFYELDGSVARQYDFHIEASSPIDIFLVSYTEFQNYKSSRTYYSEFRAVSESSLRRTLELPSSDTYYLVVDNSATPTGGAPGTRLVTLTAGYAALFPVGEFSSFDDFLRTLFLRQEYWEVPFVSAVGVAGPTLIFLIIAIPAAIRATEESDTWWIALGVMIALGGALTLVTDEGFYFDTRILTLPAAALGYWTYRRTSNTLTAAASVFSAAFFGGFLGVDVLNEIMHHDEHVQTYLYSGVIGVFGGAGWGDGLIIAPLVGLAVFGGFRLSMQHARLTVAASLEGDTESGTLYLKVNNVGEHVARNVHIGAFFHGDASPTTVIEEGVLIESLEPGFESTHTIPSPQTRAGTRAPWDRIVVAARAENAEEQAVVITLTS